MLPSQPTIYRGRRATIQIIPKNGKLQRHLSDLRGRVLLYVKPTSPFLISQEVAHTPLTKA